MSLGEQIKAKRKLQGLSARQLADKLGLNSENIYKWEKGATPSDPEDYNAIRKWLDLENNPNDIPSDGPREYQAEIKEIFQRQNLLLEVIQQHAVTTNKLLERLADNVEVKVAKIDASLTDALVRVDSVKMDVMVSGNVVLRSLARLENKSENELVDEADNTMRDLIRKHSEQNSRVG